MRAAEGISPRELQALQHNLPTSPYISLHLPTSPYISLHLPVRELQALLRAAPLAPAEAAARRVEAHQQL